MQYHCYTDETQFYLSFDTCDGQVAMARLNSCLFDIRAWMADNFRIVNEDQTKLLLIENPKREAKIQNFQLLVDENAGKP